MIVPQWKELPGVGSLILFKRGDGAKPMAGVGQVMAEGSARIVEIRDAETGGMLKLIEGQDSWTLI